MARQERWSFADPRSGNVTRRREGAYESLTDLGQTVLTHGSKTGTGKLAAEEATIDDAYDE